MIFCQVRSIEVAATPEERVRQNLIRKMIGELGFPKGLVAVEKTLSHGRRADIICYASVKRNLVPLVVVECKAGILEKGAERQAVGYNDFIGAPFICLAGAAEIRTFWREGDAIASVPFLPSYSQLVEKLC